MAGIDGLTSKDKAELIDLIEEQSDQIKALQKQVNKSNKENNTDIANKSVEGIASAFDTDILKTITAGFNTVKNTLSSLNPFDTEVLRKVDEYATQVQRNFGLSKARMTEFKQLFGETAGELSKLGMEEDDIVDVITDAMDGLNTAASLSKETIIELGATSKLTGQDVEDLTEGFRGVGISMKQVGDEMKEVVNYARSVGVSVSQISKGVVDNLGKLNLYNFDNGVQGLAKMAATSERMGISMQDTFRIAEDLFSPEKAINLSASLQRLGVTANGLLDPLRAMDMAQNDPEALQKEIVNLSKEFTTFNEKTGKMEILPGAKRRLREIAGELNIDAGEFAKMSIQAADFDRKLKQIRMPALAEGDEETKELIASMAQLDASGTAKIMVKNVETGFMEEKAVEELTPDDIENLKKANEESSKSIEEIAINQLDETKQINALLQSGQIAAQYGKAIAPSFDKFGGVIAKSTKSVAARYREEVGSVRDIANKYQSVAGSLEDITVGALKGGAEGDAQAAAGLKNFESAIGTVFGSYFDKAESFLSNSLTDIISVVDKAYMGEKKSQTEPQTVNVNVKVEGDANTAKMDQKQITNAVLQGLQDPNTSNAMSSTLNGGTAPSAVTGGKNTP